MIISGLIGLVIFATFPVAPPSCSAASSSTPSRSARTPTGCYSHRVSSTRYMAVPSLHFGWNLLVGVMWYKLARVGFGAPPL